MRTIAAFVVAMAAGILSVATAAAQDVYPSKPVRLLVGSEPGGTTDLVARVVSAKMSDLLGQRVFVENRPGANQTIAADLTARADPDGYTILIIPAGFAINAALGKKLPYDPVKDFKPIVNLAVTPNVLLANPAVPVRSVAELIAYARAKPGALNYGSSGVGSPSHLAGALFAMMTGVDIVHVPYKGSGPAMVGVVGGSIQLSFPSVPTAIPFISAGQLAALGVTSRMRSSALPGVPTIAEAGVPGYEVDSWFGIVGPAALPEPIAIRLNKVINEALTSADMREALARVGAEPTGGTSEAFARSIETETKKWFGVLKTGNIDVQ